MDSRCKDHRRIAELPGTGSCPGTERSMAAVLKRRANQHYDMAGLAAQDGDKADAARHLSIAQGYDEQLKELMADGGNGA